MLKEFVIICGIPHYTLNFKKEFKECVINNFIESYSNAETPNPCIECNKYLKFNYFYKKALELDCNYIATGHYAKTEFSDKYNQIVLKKSKAIKKDQSYVLYNIPREIIPKVLFPLGDFESKDQIRKIASEHNLRVANKPDSQEICFIPDNDYEKFLRKNLKQVPIAGNIIDKYGNLLGKHNGLINYTIGQRKGLGISNKTPLYVIELDKERNEVIVGEEKDIFKKELLATNLNYTVNIDISKPILIKAKIRYSAKEAEAKLEKINNEMVKVTFKNPQRAITKGQSVVFYIDDIVIGGGKIV
jgi:tRNA-specific 2-thiouridylase